MPKTKTKIWNIEVRKPGDSFARFEQSPLRYAFAKPELYEYLESKGIGYAIRLPVQEAAGWFCEPDGKVDSIREWYYHGSRRTWRNSRVRQLDLGNSGLSMTPQVRPGRLILVSVSIIIVIGLLILARGALFPFVLSGALAYLLLPLVRTLEKWMPWKNRWPAANRVLAVLLIYIIALFVIAGALALILPPVFRQGQDFVESVPELYAGARTTVEGWAEAYTDRIPESLRGQIEKSFGSGSFTLIQAAQRVLAKAIGGVFNAITTVIGLAIVPIFLFYLLKDREAAVERIFSILPASAQVHARNVMAIVNRVLGAYIRAQLTLGIFVGLLVFLGQFALGTKYSVLLGVIAGLTELVPVIGPLLGAIPGVLVALATSPEDIVWVILLYVAVQLVENAFLAPRVQSHAVNIHPMIIMILIVIGSEAAGLWGVIIAIPLAAVARDVFKYFYQEWSEQPVFASEEVPQMSPAVQESTVPPVDSLDDGLGPPESSGQ